MTYRTLAATVAAGVIALAFATNETVAQPGVVAAAPRPAVTPIRPVPHAARAFRHRNRFNGGFFWPGYGDDAYGAYAPTGEPVTSPLAGPNDVRYTTTYDVPWDWVHRFPPNVTPSDRPYVPGCDSETVDVGDGKTVNVIRCY
jgi:hypothetical protein